MDVVLNDPQGLPVSLGIQLLQAGQLTLSDVLGRAHHPLQRLDVYAGAAAIPSSEAACQKALYGASVEVPKDLGPQAKFLWAPVAM